MIYKLIKSKRVMSCFGCVFPSKNGGCKKPRELESCGLDIYVIGEIKNV